jgi:lysophospholipase L1-like esterase
VGTNDVAGLEPEEFLAKYRNLLLAIRDKNSSIYIVISAILPRWIDFFARGDKVNFLNDQLKRLAIEVGDKFLSTETPFLTKGPRVERIPRYELYNRKDKLHLSPKGERVLRRQFAQVLGAKSVARKLAGLE